MVVDREAIVRAFERAPGLVDRLRGEAPFASAGAVVARARMVLSAMSEKERTGVLDAHPRIGAATSTLSEASRREQGNDSDEAVERELAELNGAYEARFGFRFVVFVAGRSKAQIVPILRERLGRGRGEELETGIDEFLAIARDRLRT